MFLGDTMVNHTGRLTRNMQEKVPEDRVERLKYGAVLDDAYLKIKEMMHNNQLVPGQKIIYSDLAKKLNTSVTPIIQALKRLESSKIVRYFPNKGYIVMEATETELRDLYEAREALEIFILPKIIKSATPECMAEIRAHFKKEKVTDPRKWAIVDGEFHLALDKLANNEVIHHQLEEIYERIYLRYKPQYLGEQRLHEALKEHRAILTALENGNLKELGRIIKDHTTHQRDYTIQYMLK